MTSKKCQNSTKKMETVTSEVPPQITIQPVNKSLQQDIASRISLLQPVNPDQAHSVSPSKLPPASIASLLPNHSPSPRPTSSASSEASSTSSSASKPSSPLSESLFTAMALANPLLMFPTPLMLQNKVDHQELLKNIQQLIPQLPPMMAPIFNSMIQPEKPKIADSFRATFSDNQLCNIRALLENVNATVTQKLLEDNLRKWAASKAISPSEIWEQLAKAQPVPMEAIDDDNDSTVSSAGSRVRTQISEEQSDILRRFYDSNPKPKREELQQLADDIGQSFRVVKVWFQNTRARERRESVAADLAKQFPNTVFGADSGVSITPTKLISNPDLKAVSLSQLPPSTTLILGTSTTLVPKYPTPPASCSTDSQKSPRTSPLPKKITGSRDTDTPLDLSTKVSPTPSPSNSPPPLVINSDPDGECTEQSDVEEEEPKFKMTARPPIDIDALAKTHFDNMIQAKLVKLEPEAPEIVLGAVKKEEELSVKLILSPDKEKEVVIRRNGSGKPIYCCDQCDKTFTKKSSITRHKYEHSGEKTGRLFLQRFKLFKPPLLSFQIYVHTSVQTAKRLSSTNII